jgi:hypothetical protein
VVARASHVPANGRRSSPFGRHIRQWNLALHGGIGSTPTFFSWWYNMCAVKRQFDYSKIFSSPYFFLSLLLPKYEGVFSFIFYIQFGSYFFYCYLVCFFYIFFWLIFLFNYIPHHLILFDFYIKFGPYFLFIFLKLLLNEFCFQFHPSTFDFNLFLCQIWSSLFLLLYFLFVLDPFF